MATPSTTPSAALGGTSRFGEIRRRLLFLLGALIVFRMGSFIPVPGINPFEVARFFQDQSNTIFGMVNMLSGGALSRFSIFALGVMPYISASIIVQMATMIIPSMQALRKEGESGRRKTAEYTRYLTVPLAVFQGMAAAIALQKNGMVLVPGFSFVFIATLTMTTGVLFLMWLGEQITERGIGNGISMIILIGIIAGLPAGIGGTLRQVQSGEMNGLFAMVLLLLIVGVTAFVVFVERGQRRIAVNYAKRQVGRRMYAGQTSHLPFKINMSGVIPAIFASSLLLFPATIAGFFGSSTGQPTAAQNFMQQVSAALNYGQPLHLVLFAFLIIFFCFFYTALVFNARDTADNLKKSNAIIPGIRPGQQTAEYLDKVLTRLTLWGALYMTAVCILPELLRSYGNVPFQFGGTSLLILVVVIMDFMAQLQAHMVPQQYESLMKKAHLRGYGKST